MDIFLKDEVIILKSLPDINHNEKTDEMIMVFAALKVIESHCNKHDLLVQQENQNGQYVLSFINREVTGWEK